MDKLTRNILGKVIKGQSLNRMERARYEDKKGEICHIMSDGTDMFAKIQEVLSEKLQTNGSLIVN